MRAAVLSSGARPHCAALGRSVIEGSAGRLGYVPIVRCLADLLHDLALQVLYSIRWSDSLDRVVHPSAFAAFGYRMADAKLKRCP